jgi:hypothetical protein
MRFEADFRHEEGDREITIYGRLTRRELETLAWFRESGRADPEVTAMAMALRHAYREAPAGFLHIKAGVRLLPDQ